MSLSERWTFEWQATPGGPIIGGTLAAYNISNVVIEEGENAPGTMKWDIATGNAELYNFFQAGSRIRLFLDDTRFWEGYVIDPVTEILPGQERFRLTARDCWSFFERTPARQTWRNKDDEPVDFGRLLFFAEWDAAGESIVLRNCAQEITDLATDLIALGGKFSLGSISSGSTPSAEQLANVTFKEAYEAVNKYDQGIGYFAYGGVGDPVFNWKVPSSLTAVTVGMGNGYGMAKLEVAPTRTGALKYATVHVLNPDASAGTPAPVDLYKATYPPLYDFGVEGASMDGVDWSIDQADEFSALDAANLAQAMYEAGQAAGWQGSLVYQEQECSRDLCLGKKLSVVSPSNKWATMNAPIRHCTYNIDEGTTEVTFGPSTRLGSADLYSLVRANASKMRAGLAALKTKATGQTDQWSFSGDGDRGGANGSPLPMGYEEYIVDVYSKALGAQIEGKILINRTHAAALADPIVFRVLRVVGDDLVLSNMTSAGKIEAV